MAPPLADQTPRLMELPAQFATSVAKRVGSGLSIVRPLMPMMKSKCGSSGVEGEVLARTWKPWAEFVRWPEGVWVRDCCCEGSASRREMKRFRVPKRLAIVVGGLREGLLEVLAWVLFSVVMAG